MVLSGPDTVKLNSLVAELKASADMVELDVTENQFSSVYGVKAKLMAVLTSLYAELPSHVALIR